MKNKDLELIRRIIQVATIIICAVLIPVFLIFLISPDLLIQGYSYDRYAHLYILWTILFLFLLVLALGINAIAKRYIKRSMEENTNFQQSNQPIVQHSVSNSEGNLKFCPSCGAEILDKIGGFCSKCGAPIK